MWFALPVLWHQDPELMFINWSTIFNCEHHLLAAAYLCVLSLALSPYLFLSLLILPWQWERLRVGGEGDDRGWDGWMASLTPWTWVWVDSRSWWWTARPGVLRFLVSQRVGHDWATELNWTSKISKAFMIDQIKFCRPLVRLYVEFLFIRISSRIQFVMRVSWYIASLPVSGAS